MEEAYMGLLDRVKAGAEQAASTAQRQAQTVQIKRELSQAYNELGKSAYSLVERGQLAHPELAAGIDRIKELESRLAGLGGDAGGDSGDSGNGEADITE